MSYVYYMQPGNRLRELRKKRRLKQSDIANATGISQPAVSQVENGTRPLTLEWMRAFARVLECSVADILDEQDNPDRLTDDEKDWLALYRSADPSQRKTMKRVSEAVRGGPGVDPDQLRKAAG